MTNRTTRVAIIITVAVLVIVGIVVGVRYLHRGTPSVEPSPVPVSDSPVPSYEPTDQYGSPEPGLPRGQAIAGGGGTTTGPAGMPLGYGHDETGAVNAATNYLMWMNSLRITDKKTADQLAAATAADSATRQAMIESFDAVRPGMSDMSSDQPEPARGAYAIADYSPDSALIYIWSPEVTTDKSGQTDHLWGIEAVRVVWSQDDWKLDGGLIMKSGGAAVDPADPAGDPTAEEKHSILSRTPADPGEITDTADQSWFEYSNAPH